MMSLSANPIRQIVTTILVVSMSVCCCQAQFLVHGISDAGILSNAGNLGAGPTATGCCPGCADETPADDGGDHDQQDEQAPTTSCKTCCLKGTGLKDMIQLPAMVPVALLAAPAPAIVMPAPSAVALAPTATAPYVAPPTLLRLRCALIV